MMIIQSILFMGRKVLLLNLVHKFISVCSFQSKHTSEKSTCKGGSGLISDTQ